MLVGSEGEHDGVCVGGAEIVCRQMAWHAVVGVLGHFGVCWLTVARMGFRH